ncbi:MAG: FAD-dependent oxidoreductase [Alphaproteobacteria bacterium]|jgi:dimethylglycine dehydrogenase|nr:FAD-dependent oxidoreductase [Alphaproteobacteria bacterium]
MKSSARVVVIGGGVVGVSALYHLAKKGWNDVVLVERTELTAGSTWHAAGLLPLFNMSYSVGQLHQYSVELYKTLEAETGQAVGLHVNGNLRLARNRERMDEYRNYQCTAETIGVECHLIGVDEIKKLWPIGNMDGLIGALWHPTDGHIAPVDVTMALAKGARARGAEIYQQTEVTGIERNGDGEWVVKTTKGDITCEHVISCTGNYARTTAKMVGLEIPAIPVEHQYIVTDVDPVLKEYREAGNPELPVLRESDSSYYFREERMGWILGPYEKGAPACFADGVPASFEKDLFPGDLERLMPHVEAAIHRVPSFENAGIKDIVNGPISYTPDGNPMVGPAFGLPNFWISEGHSFGVTAAGGAGWQIAEWIVEGEPTVDMIGVDPRRFGVVSKNFAKIKNEEAYEHVFVNHFPMEERPAARPAKAPPIYDRLDKAGAVWGARFGWERPNWFAPAGTKREDIYSFRRSNWFEPVGNEVRAMRENVGMMELSSFAKYEVEGSGAREWLDRMVANNIPKGVGRMSLSHALNPSGSVRSEFTISRMSDGLLGERFFLVGPGAAHDYDFDFLTKSMPRDGSVHLRDVTNQYGVLVLAGPNSRKVLEKIADADVSNEAFKWLTMREIPVGFCPNVRAMRVNFVGSLGWELHHPIEYQIQLFEALRQAGAEFRIANVGMRAMDSMRLEKSYRLWGTDLNAENTILEAGLNRFVRLNKGEFTGRDALVLQQERGVPNQYCTIEIDADDADAFGNEPVLLDGEVIGRGTAGGYGHFVGKSLMLGYVKTEHAKVGLECHVRVLDQLRPARIIAESPYDPENLALRA